jgi:hypothetical protein
MAVRPKTEVQQERGSRPCHGRGDPQERVYDPADILTVGFEVDGWQWPDGWDCGRRLHRSWMKKQLRGGEVWLDHDHRLI